jgi:serine protease
MKLKFSPVTIALLGVMSTPLLAASDQSTQRYIVKYKNNQQSAMSLAISQEGGKIKRRLAKHRMISADLSIAALKKLELRKDIEFIEIDPKRYLMAESTPFGITMVQADQVSDSLTGNMTVCITDTGYSLGHEDLSTSGVTGDDNDGNGNDSGNWFEDGHGHGTHVSGTIAALGNNDLGVVGVNPGGNLNIHMVKVFDSNGAWAYGSDLAAAIDQCATSGAKVISMSLGGGAPSTVEEAAFDNAAANGILAIAAAGNDGNSSLSYPASYDSVMSVAAVDSNGNKASFSQFNAQVEIAAPGVGVLSTLPGNTYAAWDGTSMATPHVAGVAALVWSHYPNCTRDEIRQAINKSAEDRGSQGRDDSYGHGIVKAKDMFDMLAVGCDVGPIDPPPPPPPATELQKGVAETGLAANPGTNIRFTMDVPADTSDLSFVISGGTGDADIYVSFDTEPTTSSYECRPFLSGNEETCSFPTPQTGTYHVMLDAFTSYSGVSLIGDYTEGGEPPPPPPANIDLSVTTQLRGTTGRATLSWSGASGNSVDVYRNAVNVKTTQNDGSYRDKVNNVSGNYIYQICEFNSDVCSAEVTVTF